MARVNSSRTAIEPDLAAARMFLANVSANALRKGKHCHLAGAVVTLQCAKPGRAYVAEVQGTELYSTRLEYDDGEWFTDCSCPVGIDCKHGVAAMLELIDLTATARVIPIAPPAATVDSASAPPTRAPDFSRPAPPAGSLEKQLTAALHRPLRKAERQFVQQVVETFHRARDFRQFTNYDLQRLLPGVPGTSWENPGLWPQLPPDEVEFWQCVAFGLRERGVAIPEFMLAVTDFERTARLMADWRRKKQIDEWTQRLQWAGTQRATSNAVEGPADFRLAIGEGSVEPQWKPARQPEFGPLKPTRLKQLFEAYDQGGLEVLPDAFPIWHALVQHYALLRQTKLDPFNDEVRRALNALLRLPGLHERIVTPAGVPFARATDPLRWQLQPATTPTGDYSLRLVTADGAPAPEVLLTLSGRPTLYVTATTIYPGPPPLEAGPESPHEVSIPAPALEGSHGVGFLQRLGLDLPPRLQERTQRVPLKVTIACELKPLYAGSESEALFLRVSTTSAPGGRRETYTAGGWQATQVGAPPVAKSTEVIYLYDRSELAAVPPLLEPLGLTWDNYDQCWRLRLTRKFPERFAAWLQSLPPSIEVLVDRELATLGHAPVSASVKLDCAEAGVDWFDLKVVLAVADTELTPQELKALLDARGGFVRLGKKGWRRLQFNLTAEEDEMMSRLGLSPRDFSSEPQRLHALQLADEAAARFLPETQVAAIRRRAGEIKTRVTPPLPGQVRAELRPYQLEGFHFLAYLSANRFGGVLADDMGLGKTLQTLAWLVWLRGAPGAPHRPSLVVCPKSVMDNWQAEANRFVPGLRVRLWRGADPAELRAALADADLLVLNYAQLRSLGATLTAVNWLAAILDEGQFIKNPDSQTARIARALKADHRLVLTGTPIENRLLDLWSLMAFAMPGVLGTRAQFVRHYDRADDPLARRRLAARVRPFLLRRTKSQVATELPDRIEEDLLCELEGEQQTLYRAEFKRAQLILLKVKTRQDLDRERFNFLTSLLRLRQICCHPALVDAARTAAESAKLTALLDLLEPLMEEGHKVLVFSQFVTMIELLQPVLQEKNWRHFVLTGQTENRGPLVAEFQNAPGAAVFLVSLKAGGFGLNLTAASYVVLFDPWWNPAVETQAIDRTHRIGQTSKVVAYRLLIKDSIEEKIRHLQRAKRALATDVLGEETFAQSLTIEDLRFLFDSSPATK